MDDPSLASSTRGIVFPLSILQATRFPSTCQRQGATWKSHLPGQRGREIMENVGVFNWFRLCWRPAGGTPAPRQGIRSHPAFHSPSRSKVRQGGVAPEVEATVKYSFLPTTVNSSAVVVFHVWVGHRRCGGRRCGRRHGGGNHRRKQGTRCHPRRPSSGGRFQLPRPGKGGVASFSELVKCLYKLPSRPIRPIDGRFSSGALLPVVGRHVIPLPHRPHRTASRSLPHPPKRGP